MVWLLVCAGVLSLCIVLRLVLRSHQERQAAGAEQFRRTRLYARVYPLMQDLADKPVEQVAVLEDRLVIRLLRPHREVQFHYETQGFDPPGPAARLAMAQALGLDFPFLNDPDRYVFRSHRHRLLNGERSRWYEYLLTAREKERMLNRPGRRSHVPESR
jgi:hypothetical protein